MLGRERERRTRRNFARNASLADTSVGPNRLLAIPALQRSNRWGNLCTLASGFDEKSAFAGPSSGELHSAHEYIGMWPWKSSPFLLFACKNPRKRRVRKLSEVTKPDGIRDISLHPSSLVMVLSATDTRLQPLELHFFRKSTRFSRFFERSTVREIVSSRTAGITEPITVRWLLEADRHV